MYEFYSSRYVGTDYLYSSSFSRIESIEGDLDINLDSRDQNIIRFKIEKAFDMIGQIETQEDYERGL